MDTGRLGWQYKELPDDPSYHAPDGSEVRILARLEKANMAHFRLTLGQVTQAVAHRSIDEFWYIVSGEGEMWLKLGSKQEKIVALRHGISIAIPVGTHFQFRSTGPDPLNAIGVSVPAWPGPHEAYDVDGKWPPNTAQPD